MLNLRECKGSFKGLIGECMFKLTNKRVVITRFFNITKYFRIFGKYLSKQQSEFLRQNWFSIDAIEITFETGRKKIRLYEIKTKNKYSKEMRFKPKITSATVKMYSKAKGLGFIVNYATVWFLSNWDFEVEILEFNEQIFYIDKPKRYDKRMP
ncbi:hypothetical protein ACFL0W_04790 [Nanoarchaeota archaeon]